MEEIEQASRLRDHLLRGVIEFWVQHALAEPRGGYFAQFARDGTPVGDVQHLPTCARIASAFAITSCVSWSSRYLSASRRGIHYILEFFRDREQGGWFLEIEADGRIRSDAKLPAGHALVVEALAEYASEARDDRTKAIALAEWGWLRERLWDRRHGGFSEAMDRSGCVVRERKTLGTHLCALNALLSLCRALPEERAVRTQALEVAAIIADRMRD
ncbi:MAG: AGE family epimerase/isomerase, partial [Planctomycetes bacterium]|nr:AGE family epimerase/isomerase [Planctomycetota bacterium]